jgi:hypothetical protein
MGNRVPRREVVAVDTLPTIAELEQLLALQVERYLHRRRDSLNGLSPALAYQEKRSRRPRNGRDLMSILPSHTGTVGARGITLQRNRVRHSFAAATATFRYRVDHALTFRCDPLFRGLFAMQGREQVFLPRLIDEARATDPGQFARDQRGAARMASEVAAEASTQAAISAIATSLATKIHREVLERVARGEQTPEAPSEAASIPAPVATPEAVLYDEVSANLRPRRQRLPGSRGFAPRPNLDDAAPDTTPES